MKQTDLLRKCCCHQVIMGIGWNGFFLIHDCLLSLRFKYSVSQSIKSTFQKNRRRKRGLFFDHTGHNHSRWQAINIFFIICSIQRGSVNKALFVTQPNLLITPHN